jgi:hypothetical protein
MIDDPKSLAPGSEEASGEKDGTAEIPASFSVDDDSDRRRRMRERTAELRRQFAEDLARVHELGLPRSR